MTARAQAARALRVARPLALLALPIALVLVAGILAAMALRREGENATIRALASNKDEAVAVGAPPPVLLARITFLLDHDRVDEVQPYVEALDRRGDDHQRATAHYDFANGRLRQGFDLLTASHLDKAGPYVVLARQEYRRALTFAPDDWDAKFNLDVASRLIRDFPAFERTIGDTLKTDRKKIWTDVPGKPAMMPATSLPWRDNLREPRTLFPLAALAFALIAIILPPVPTTRDGVDVLAVVDITGSMNTRDYKLDGKPASRLAVARAALKDMIGDLPCPSRLGLALFTERTPFLLFEPVDICRDYGAVAGAIDAIDWREGWEGDSHVAEAIFKAIDMAKGLKSDLLFITDGQESPPLPFSGGPEFDGKRGAVKGLLVGAGGYALSPIPKFDDRGNEIGFWSESEVPRESRFGLPPPDAANRPGYNARNAPFGGEAAIGTEHLSSVRQTYLEGLAAKTGLGYVHLDGPRGLAAALEPVATPHAARGTLDLRAIPGALALSALLAVYLLTPLRDALRLATTRRRREVV